MPYKNYVPMSGSSGTYPGLSTGTRAFSSVTADAGWEYGYFMVLGLMLIACGGLYWRFRRAGWL